MTASPETRRRHPAETRWAIFLRAVNVGGTGIVRMAELRAALEAKGFGHVRTRLQSGNVVVDAPGATEAGVAEAVSAVLRGVFGLDRAVLVRSAPDLRDVVARTPFGPPADPKLVLVHLFAEPPEADATAELTTWGGPEAIAVAPREIYVHYVAGVSRSKLEAFRAWRQLARHATARNVDTLRAVERLLEEP